MYAVIEANKYAAFVIVVVSQINDLLVRAIAKFRPRSVILVVTDDCRWARQFYLYRDLFPILYTPGKNLIYSLSTL